jgi:heat shock protein HslJ
MPTDLDGTAWTLTALDGSSPLEGTQITLDFGEGQAHGSTGCNTYWATYAQDGVSLNIVGLAMTERACLDPPGAMEQEQRYLDLLRAAVRYRIAGNELSLMAAAGQTLAYIASDVTRPMASVAAQATEAPAAPPPDLPTRMVGPTGVRPTPIGGPGYAPGAPAADLSTPTAGPTPIGSPAHTPTSAVAEGDAGPTVHYFLANVTEADPGDTIVLEWGSSGGVAAVLYHLLPGGQLPHSGWQVALTGVYTYEISPDERNLSEFFLYVYDEAERAASANLGITLRCPVPWFFEPAPTTCGSNPVHSQAAEEHFQRGTMVWVGQRDAIFVLYDDGAHPKWDMFVDEYDEGDPAHDPAITPPEGLRQPIRGFGLVWRDHPEVRERLGWAIDREKGFDTIVQTTTLYKYNSTYIRALDGDVWHLGPERASWDKIRVTVVS